MKQYWVALIGVVLLFSGCDNPTGNSTDDDLNEGETVETAIQGSLPAEARSLRSSRAAGVSISSALLFYGDDFVQKDLSDGSFYLPVETEEPAGIVFLGSDDSFQGYVSIRDDSNVLPLHGLGANPVLIDLGELSLPEPSGSDVGHRFRHGKDIKSYLPEFDDNLLNSVTGASALFSSVIENPDFDGNGSVDVLEDKFIDPTLVFYTGTLGAFGADNTPTVAFDAGNLRHKIVIATIFPHELTNGTLLRPGQSAPDSSAIRTGPVPDVSFWFELFDGVPPDGRYVFGAEYVDGAAQTINYTFRVPSGVSSIIEDNLLIIRPIVELEAGNLARVSWDVLYPDLTPVAKPELILTELEIQIDDAAGRVYDSGWIPVADGSHTIGKTIAWSDVGGLYMTYNDCFGNHYVNQYDR